MLRTSRNEMLRLLDPGLGRPAMFTGTRLVRALREVVGEPRIDTAQADQFFDNGTHLTQKGAIQRSETIAAALLASPQFLEWRARRPQAGK